MSLADRVKNPPGPPKTGYPCSVGELLRTLKGAELDALKIMLGTPEKRGWSASDIYKALTAEGHAVSDQQINRHRGGKCRCSKEN